MTGHKRARKEKKGGEGKNQTSKRQPRKKVEADDKEEKNPNRGKKGIRQDQNDRLIKTKKIKKNKLKNTEKAKQEKAKM